MKISHRAATAAFALSCLSAGTFAHAEPRDMRREPVSVRVSHAGLDLHTAAGRARFDARVRRAATYACAPFGVSIQQRDTDRCIDEMLADAAAHIAARHLGNAVQLASATR